MCCFLQPLPSFNPKYNLTISPYLPLSYLPHSSYLPLSLLPCPFPLTSLHFPYLLTSFPPFYPPPSLSPAPSSLILTFLPPASSLLLYLPLSSYFPPPIFLLTILKMIPWKTTQKQALVPQNSTYSILRTFSSPLDIMG